MHDKRDTLLYKDILIKQLQLLAEVSEARKYDSLVQPMLHQYTNAMVDIVIALNKLDLGVLGV